MSSAILSGVVFAASTLPLGMFGAEPITLKVGDRPTFSGRFEELATPYLALTTILSLGIGVATTALFGWQSSSQQLAQAEERLSTLKQQLDEKESLLEHLRFSEQKLHSTGLNFFLESDTAAQPKPTNGEDQRVNYFSSVNLQPPAAKQPTGSKGLAGSASPDLSAYNLKDETQVEALLENLRHVMSQIEKLKTN